MLKNINDYSIRYIVIAFYKNSADLLQYKGVLSNIFHILVDFIYGEKEKVKLEDGLHIMVI